MKRIDRTAQALATLCDSERRGVNAAELAMRMGVARQNVSADLNQLVRDGRAVKEEGRPVLYWSPSTYERVHRKALPARREGRGPVAVEPKPTPRMASQPPTEDPLGAVIGAEESLRRALEQARAAVLYPPHGLHTLLLGPTGVGKSFLAERMHGYGVASGRLPAGAPFVTLNCADYAANPQLLLAQLFGSVRGAYTGAERDRLGLVQQADGGILFLDEVHRLPPEGQEMLFRLIDKGLVRRLGETGAERAVRVMLIAATTERPDSVLLQTFVRRIPMLIPLPPLAERTPGERLRFIRHLLEPEVAKLGLELLLPLETLRLLMEYGCPGNVGQLKSDLQIACARLFLQVLTSPASRTPARLLTTHLPDHVLRTTPPVRHRSRAVEELLQELGGPLLVRGAPADEGRQTASLYDRIEAELQELTQRGLSRTEAASQVSLDLERHAHAFIAGVRRRHQTQRPELAKLVGEPLLKAVEGALQQAEVRLGRVIPERLLYTLALHIHAFLERAAGGLKPALLPVQPPTGPHAGIAQQIVAALRTSLGAELPASDEAFVALLLGDQLATDPTATDPEIGLVLLAHGGVASAMSQVATALTGLPLCEAIDMALETPTALIEEGLVAAVEAGRYSGGLLLLVDMGSLEAIGEALQRRTGLPVRTIPLVSTPLVIEALHQLSVPGATLDQVHQAVLNSRATLLGRDTSLTLPGVVLTFCFTGVGGAQTLARLVRQTLVDLPEPIEVIPAALGAGSAWRRLVETLLRAHRLRAVVGPVPPNLEGVPYIATQELLQGEGAQRLRRLCHEGATPSRLEPVRDAADPGVDLVTNMALALAPHLKATNPVVTVPLVTRCLQGIEAQVGPLDAGLRVGLTMHLACLLDRQIQARLDGRPAISEPKAGPYLPWLPGALRELQEFTRSPLSAEELGRISEILQHSV